MKKRLVVLMLVSMFSLGSECDPEAMRRSAPEGIRVTSVEGPETIDPCTYRYSITFKDSSGASNPVYYWVGIYRDGDRFALSSSDLTLLVPPFGAKTLTCDLKTHVDGSTDNVRGIVVRTSNSNEVPGHIDEWTYGDQSNDPVDVPNVSESCCPIELVLTDNYTVRNSGEPVYISTQPVMPSLSANIAVGTANGFLDWQLSIVYNRTERNDTLKYSNRLPAGIPWNIPFRVDTIRGGEAILTCFSEELRCAKSITFCIRGANLGSYEIEQYIGQACNLWYAKYIGIVESNCGQQGRCLAQFNTDLFGPVECGPDEITATPNTYYNPDRHEAGFGIYQLTYIFNDAHKPSAQCLWSWKANIDTASAVMAGKQTSANSFMAAERSQALNDNGGLPFGYQYGSVVFGPSLSDPRPIEHAVGIKRYNGNGGSGESWNFVYYDIDQHNWCLNEFNNDNVNYVERVCLEVQ